MFRVEWFQSAVNELATAWLQADSAERRSITDASQLIERRLQRGARTAGESRSGGRRIIFAPPLAAVFRVEADGQTVTVEQVRFFRPRTR
jgi:hypothetical protein